MDQGRGISSTSLPDYLIKPQDSLDIREFGRTLIRRRNLILGTLGSTVLVTLLFTLLSTPVYRATATLQIERESTRAINLDFMGTDDIRDTRDFYQTQFELIRSRALAAQVIEDLKLSEAPSASSWVGRIKNWFGSDSDNARTELENTLLDNLSVEPVKNSRLVAVSYTAASPEEAARIANAAVDAFSRMNAFRRSHSINETASLLEKSVQETKTRLDETQAKVDQYTQENAIFEGNNTGTPQTLSGAARLQQLTAELNQLQEQRTAKENRYNQLAANNRVVAEGKVPPQLRALQTDIDTLKANEEGLHTQIASAKEAVLAEQKKLMELNNLKRDLDVTKTLYQNMLQRLKETSIAAGALANNVTVIDPAQVPLKKYKPNLPTNLVFATLLGLMLGITAALLREFLDNTARDIPRLEKATGLPVLGIIPEAPAGTAPNTLAQMAFYQSRSPVAEAYRTLRTTLFQPPDHANGVLLVTSAEADEGKSTVASNLASTHASTGKRVLLVDADLRNPSLHQMLGVSSETGLAEYLSGKVDHKHLISGTDTYNLYFIPAGQNPDDPAGLLASSRMQALLHSARKEFDQVIVDAPPVLGLADATVLAPLADRSLLVVKAGSTQLDAINHVLKRLRPALKPIAGILLNRVDLNKSHHYVYGYAHYHYQALKR